MELLLVFLLDVRRALVDRHVADLLHVPSGCVDVFFDSPVEEWRH
jgi:hypothetical protein